MQWYKRKFTTAEDIALDTAALQPGGVTPISYHITPHVFVDECVDPPASVATASERLPRARSGGVASTSGALWTIPASRSSMVCG